MGFNGWATGTSPHILVVQTLQVERKTHVSHISKRRTDPETVITIGVQSKLLKCTFARQIYFKTPCIFLKPILCKQLSFLSLGL